MSYSDFLNNLISPITAFVNWLSTMANSLITNYYFITFLGITIFISLFWLLFNLIFNHFDRINKRYDDYNDKYYNYELSKEVHSAYLDKHYSDEYDYRYRNKVLNSQVLNGYLQNNEQLDIDNRILSNKNRMSALKSIKNELLDDNDDSNDSDIDLIVPPKKVELASVKELNKNLIEEYPNLHNELVKENNDLIDKILLENGYIDYKGNLVDIKTGETVDISNNSKNIINLGQFVYYDKIDKIMKNIALPVIDNDDGSFQFDNENLSDIDKDFILNHTLIRK